MLNLNTLRPSNTLRSLKIAAQAATRRHARAALEPMEARQLMSATSVKSIDTGGPEHMLVEAAGTVYAISSDRSGGGWELIYATKGPANTTRKLVDLNDAGTKIASLDDLFTTGDGRVFFTATGGTGGGRQLFQLNTTEGGYTQITSDEDAFYTETMAIGGKVYLYDSTHTQIVTLDSKNETKLVADAQIVRWYQAKGQLFYSLGDAGVFRTDGTAGGTYKISGDLNVSAGDVFVSNDWIYFEGNKDNNTSLYRADGSNAAPTKLADDFSLRAGVTTVEVGDSVYFSGGYFGTSPEARGGELYRVKSATGEVTPATDLPNGNGGGAVEGIAAIGTNIYFTANDTEFITSQGTPDRELYRYDTVTGVTKMITTAQTLYPTEVGGGVLSSYYFVAAPTKDDARFGSRRLYRTTPENDQVEEVAGLPSYQDSNDVTRQLVGTLLAGSAGLFYEARNDDFGGDYDTYFVPTPYSYVDPNTNVLVVEATAAADEMTMTVDGDELVMNLNGVEERRNLSTFGEIRVALKGGDDRFTADDGVVRNMMITGDSGNDTIAGGAGNDNILAGAGKNRLYGNKGQDRLRGSNGQDYLDGGDDNDRLYGWAGSDYLFGGNGVDVLYGDDVSGLQGGDSLYGGSGNDKLYGRGGDDLLVGGKQNDSLFGADGNDTLQGQDGNDTLKGEAGADEVWGHAGDDTFGDEADSALDRLDGGDGDDSLLGRDDEESLVDSIEAVV